MLQLSTETREILTPCQSGIHGAIYKEVARIRLPCRIIWRSGTSIPTAKAETIVGGLHDVFDEFNI